MKYFNLLLYYLIPFFSLAQTTVRGKELKGIIIDAASGKALAAAGLQIVHTGQRTYSDHHGRFSIQSTALSDSVLVTYVGYQKCIVPFSAHTVFLEIKLVAETGSLLEVSVSNGYQTIPKERATGSFNTIDHKVFNQQVSRNILERLEAIASGFSVDRYTGTASGQQNIMVRGQSTILGVKGPLIIVDNFPYNGDIKNINPNDVENITLLKDAAAASIWGTKAGNGVIVITMKKSRLNQQARVEISSSLSLTPKPDLSVLPQISSDDYIDLEQKLFTWKYKHNDVSNINQPPYSPVYELLFKQLKGELNGEEARKQIDFYRGRDFRDDLNRYFYQTAVSQQYAFNATGGTSRHSWLFSAGYDRNLSDLAAKDRRMNLQMNNTWKVSDQLNLNAVLYFTQTFMQSGKPGYFDLKTANGMLPVYMPLAGREGMALPVIKDYRQLFIDQVQEKKYLDWNYYPMEDYKHAIVNNNLFDLTGNLNLNYKIRPFLSAELRYQMERQQNHGNSIYDTDSYFTRNLVNRFTYIDPLSGTANYRVPKGAIADFSNQLLLSHQFRAQLNYNQNWGKHSVNAILGAEVRHNEVSGHNFRTYGYNPDNLSLSNVDYVNFYPVVLPLGQSDQVPNPMNLSKSLNRFISFYTNVAYIYDEKYMLTLSARRDASNLFGLNVNEKWTPLWSAGLGYHLSRAAFYESDAFPSLKLRGSYGFSGNADPSRVALTTISYFPFTNENTQLPYAYVSRYGNPELKWEKIRMINIGVDFETKNSRITGSIDYYRKKGTDLFGAVRIDYTTGITSGLTKNVAAIQGEGLDLTLNSLNLKGGGFRWTSSMNFSINNEKVTSYSQKAPKGSDYVSGTPLISALVGKPVYAVFSFKWAGLDPASGDPMGYVNGHVSKNYAAIYADSTKIEDLVYHGSALPTIFGSIGNEFSWKGFSFSFRLVYKFGYYFRRPSLNYTRLFDLRQGHPEFADRWQKPGDERLTNVPSMIFPAVNNRDLFYNGAEINIEKGDHVRLQYITLGYEFDQQKLGKLPCRSLQLYSSVSNPGVVWKANKKGIDPDYASGQNTVPSMTFSVGLRASF